MKSESKARGEKVFINICDKISEKNFKRPLTKFFVKSIYNTLRKLRILWKLRNFTDTVFSQYFRQILLKNFAVN